VVQQYKNDANARRRWYIVLFAVGALALIIAATALIYQFVHDDSVSTALPEAKVVNGLYSPPPRTKTSGCVIRHALPDPECTPGAVDTSVTKEGVCTRYTQNARHPNKRLDNEVFAEYGLSRGGDTKYENDHVISLELGGADADIANHFPQAYEDKTKIQKMRAGELPDDELGAHAKDMVESWLHQRVCNDKMPAEYRLELWQAQYKIATQWVAVFHELLEFRKQHPSRRRPH